MRRILPITHRLRRRERAPISSSNETFRPVDCCGSEFDSIQIDENHLQHDLIEGPANGHTCSRSNETQLLRGACCIILAVLLFVPLAYELQKSNRLADAQRVAAGKGLVDPSSCWPEPGERSSYIAGCLLVPTLLFGFVFLSRRFENRLGRVSPLHWAIVEIGSLTVLSVYAWWLLAGDHFLPIGLNAFYIYPIISILVVLIVLSCIAWLNRNFRGELRLGEFVICLPLLAMFFASLLGSSNLYAGSSNHFSAVFEPVVQVHLGKDLLVNYASQYGLYPDFLAPLFALLGFDVIRFTLVFGLLSVFSYYLLWLVLRQAIARRGVAVMGFLALFVNGWLMYQLRTLEYYSSFADLYFQYIPLRFIFPASAVAMAWCYYRNRSSRLYWFAQIVLAFGLLWNFESGLVAQAAWLAALGYDSLFANDWLLRGRKAAFHVLATFLATAGVGFAYATLKFCWFGVWPDYTRLCDFQRIFYISGFYMLPMHFQGAWQLVVLVYLAGLAQAAMALIVNDHSPRHTLVFLLSVMGLGLFSYYQGRSHVLCLIVCWWPAIVLLPMFLDELLQLVHRERNLFASGLIAIVGAFIVGSAASIVTQSPTLCRITANQLVKVFAPESPYAAAAQLLRERTTNQDGVLVLSSRSSLIHTEAQIPTLASAPLIQMLLVRQYETLLATLEGRQHSWIFIDRDYSQQSFLNPKDNLGSRLLMETISPRLQKVAETSLGCLYEFRGAKAATSLPFPH
jgi:hypothetical protein